MTDPLSIRTSECKRAESNGRLVFVAVLDSEAQYHAYPPTAHLQVFRGVASRLGRGSRCSCVERRLLGVVLVRAPS